MEVSSYYLGVLIFAVFAISSAARFFIYQRKLMKYLLEKHTEKWNDLTTIIGYGPGYANSLKGIRFLFGKDYLNDPGILRLKVIVRNSFLYTLFGMMGTSLAFCIAVAWSQKP